MNTTYEYIFKDFKDKITDPDLLLFSEELQTETLIALMVKAISRCQRIVKKVVDLSQRDDALQEFTLELPYEVIDIITEWMTVFWLQPYVNSVDNLKNHLSTSDFKYICSPANLLDKIESRYGNARKYAMSMTNAYSFIIADMRELKT